MLWLAIALLALLGVGLLLIPARRRIAQPYQDAATGDHLRRFAELDADLAAGEVSAEVSAEIRSELERAVIDALPPANSRSESAPPPTRSWLPWLLALGVPGLAAAVYLQLGSPSIAEFQLAHPELPLSKPEATMELLLNELRDRVASTPDDRRAWEMLAHANSRLGRHEEAIAAAETRLALTPDEPAALLLLANALAVASGGKIAGRALELIERVLAIEPGNTAALMLAGVALDQSGKRVLAIDAWRRALETMPSDAPLRAEVQSLIDAPLAPSAVSIKVTVSLSKALASQASNSDTLFVIARVSDKPGPPLAVSRHTVGDLPLNVVLDEQMAMMPGHTLADFNKVEVVARISQSGQPSASAGDLEGRTREIDPRVAGELSIVIDKVLPAPVAQP